MPLKLVVNKTDEPSAQPDSFVFQQERIVMGRDSATDLPLNDLKRVVSKEHAELVVSGEAIHLTDLGSKNFTYLNGERLDAGRPYPVQPGDTIRIGDFEIGVSMIDAALVPPRMPDYGADQTVFEQAFINPFEDSAKLLAVALRGLSKQYDEEPPNRREDALAAAMKEAMEGDFGHPAYRFVAHMLAPEIEASPPPRSSDPAPPPSWAAAPEPEPSWAAPPVSEPEPDFRRSSTKTAPLAEDEDRLHLLVDTVLQALAPLVGVPWQFRHEFIGQTIMRIPEREFLYEGDATVLKQNLLDPSLSAPMAAKRFRLLEEAAADVAMHQVAMLDGYKAAVRDGALNLIDQLNPESLAEEVAEEKWFYKMVPMLAKAEVLERLHAQLRELRTEDWAAAERRTYRPAFAKAYLNRMTAVRRSESASERF